MIPQLIAIAVGGAAGAIARFLVNHWAGAQWGSGFPYGTVIVILAGSFLIGIVFVWLMHSAAEHQIWRGLLITGFLGALTTFSTFSLDLLLLLESGALLKAASYVLINVLGGLLMVVASFFIGKWVF